VEKAKQRGSFDTEQLNKSGAFAGLFSDGQAENKVRQGVTKNEWSYQKKADQGRPQRQEKMS